MRDALRGMWMHRRNLPAADFVAWLGYHAEPLARRAVRFEAGSQHIASVSLFLSHPANLLAYSVIFARTT